MGGGERIRIITHKDTKLLLLLKYGLPVKKSNKKPGINHRKGGGAIIEPCLTNTVIYVANSIISVLHTN